MTQSRQGKAVHSVRPHQPFPDGLIRLHKPSTIPYEQPMNSHNHQENSAEPWLTAVFNQSPDMIIVLDREGIIRKANVAFQTFCERSASVLLGCKIAEFIPAEKRSQWTHDLNKLTSGEWTSVDGTLIGAKDRAVPC